MKYEKIFLSTISLEFYFKVYSSVTILFSDVVGFTSTCAQLTPLEVVSFLNEMYTKFDNALENHNTYKVYQFSLLLKTPILLNYIARLRQLETLI